MLTSASLVSLLAVLAASETIQDSHSLLQSTISRHQADACACLNYKDVYATGIQCGSGQEMSIYGGVDAYPWYGSTFCAGFYEKIDDNVCINQKYATHDCEEVNATSCMHQWCYVSSECEQLGGGSPVSSEISWKTCNPFSDKTLIAMNPFDLHQWAVAGNFDAGFVMKMAYPMRSKHPNFMFWDAVKFTVETGDTPEQELTVPYPGYKMKTQTYLEMHKNGTISFPLIYGDSFADNPLAPFGVVYGGMIVESHLSAWANETTRAGGDIMSAPGKVAEYECLRGCK